MVVIESEARPWSIICQYTNEQRPWICALREQLQCALTVIWQRVLLGSDLTYCYVYVRAASATRVVQTQDIAAAFACQILFRLTRNSESDYVKMLSSHCHSYFILYWLLTHNGFWPLLREFSVEILPNSMHFVRSSPFLPSNRNVIMLIRYMCPATVSQSFTFRSNHPVRLMCWRHEKEN